MAIQREGEGNLTTGLTADQLANKNLLATTPTTASGLKSPLMAYEETSAPIAGVISQVPGMPPSTSPQQQVGVRDFAKTVNKVAEQIAQVPQMLNDKATADQNAAQEIIKTPAPNPPPAPPATATGGGSGAAGSGVAPTKTTDTNTGGGTTSSGSSVSTGATTTTSGGSTPAGTEPTQSAWKPYADQAAQMKFEWNSATDPAYLQEASNLENQVAQMMVGRGGLYSSVYQSALQSRLTQLQVEMRQEKYQEFTQERTWLMQQAEFYADREDADFSKNMQMLNYQMDLDNQKFNQQMAKAELSLAQAKFSFSKQQANLATQQAGTKAEQSNLEGQYTTYNEMFKKYQAQWASSGYPSAEVQAFFGVSSNDSFWGTNAQRAIDNTTASIDSIRTTALQYAQEANDLDGVISASKGFATGSDTEIAQMAQESKYNTLKFDIMRNIDSGSEAMTALTNVKAEKATITSAIGTSNYSKLLTDLQTMANAYKYNTD